MKILRVKDWDAHFESAKSRTYAHKSQVYLPNKTGLGYRRMVQAGEDCYGAWCAMVGVLSRQMLPRQGYLTDTGRSDGIPHDHDTLSLLTGFRPSTMAKMLSAACSQAIGWIEVVDSTDTALPSQSQHTATVLPRQSHPLPLPLPSPSPSPSPASPGGGYAFGEFWNSITASLNEAFPEWRPQFDVNRLQLMFTSTAAISELAFDGETWDKLTPAISAFITDQLASSSPPRDPMRALRAFVIKFLSAGRGVSTLTAQRDPASAWSDAKKAPAADPDAPEWAQRAKILRAAASPAVGSPAPINLLRTEAQ